MKEDSELSSNFDHDSLHGESLVNNSNGNIEIGSRETKAVSWLRLGVMVVLVSTATCVATLAFLYISRGEAHEFEEQFQDQGLKIIESFQSNAERRLGTIRSLAKQITSYAMTSNSSWPFVTVPNFEVVATEANQLADVLSVILSPIITDDTRLEWEQYTRERKDWILDSISAQTELDYYEGSNVRRHLNSATTQQELHRRLRNKHPSTNLTYDGPLFQAIDPTVENPTDWVAPTIHRFGQGGFVPDDGKGPFVVNWQIAPYIPFPQMINFNVASHPNLNAVTTAVLENKLPAFSMASILENEDASLSNQGHRSIISYFLEKWKDGGKQFEDGPVAVMEYPVFDAFDKNRSLVSVLRSDVAWAVYFANVLPKNANGLVTVLENTCGQAFTFEINGADARFLGDADLHDPSYDRLELSTDFGVFFRSGGTLVNEHDGNCRYALRVYPSNAFKNDFVTNQATIYTISIVLIFIFTSLVFITYDCLVERRQQVVMNSAVKSNAIVSSLFPENVRDRLFRVNANSKQIANRESLVSKYLNGDHDFGEDTKDSGPIADSFPECTVMFADLAGFTSWSSERRPEEVFVLLESLYNSFDSIAKKRRVFKVETIGDCYLAVTGLPDPRKDHAVIMVKFAQDCLKSMETKLAESLCQELGEDTGKLRLRVGLHSGPVTAGVLRGEKSRFQLFGDTVNTAARMESTGTPGRIQVSEATASYLKACGRGKWIVPRDDVVNAKGKGTMRTFWAAFGSESHFERATTTGTTTLSDPSDTVEDLDGEGEN